MIAPSGYDGKKSLAARLLLSYGGPGASRDPRSRNAEREDNVKIEKNPDKTLYPTDSQLTQLVRVRFVAPICGGV